MRKEKVCFFICFSVFVMLFLFLEGVFVFQDQYEWVFSLNWFCEEIVGEKSIDFYTGLYSDFLLAYAGIYFTVIGIAFSLKQFSVKTFYDFTLDCESKLSLFLVLINTVIVYCVIPNLSFKNSVVCFLLINILYETFVFCLWAVKILYTDNIVWANRLYQRILHEGNRGRTAEFINKFLLKCFREEVGIIIRDNTNDKEKATEAFDSIIVRNIQNEKTLENLMKTSMLQLSNFLMEIDNAEKENKINEIDINCHKLIEFYITASRHYYFELGVDKCQFLDVRDCFLYSKNKVTSEKFYSFFLEICEQLKSIVVSCLYNKEDKVILHFINQFRYLNQFFEPIGNTKVNESFNNYLFDIVIRLYNLICVGKRNTELLVFAEKLFLSLKRIGIGCIDSELYDEGNFEEIGLHEVKYTQEYLATIVIFFTKCRKPDFDVKEFIRKKVYFKGYGAIDSKSAYLNIAISCMKKSFEKITVEEYFQFFSNTEKFEEEKKEFISILNNLITYYSKKDLEEIERRYCSKIINSKILEKKEKLRNDLEKELSKYDSKNEVHRFNIDSEFLISGKSLSGNVIEMGDSFFHAVKDLFIQLYMRTGTCIPIKSFSNLPANRDGKLLLDSNLLEYLFEDKTIQSGYMNFTIGEKVFDYSFFHGNLRGVIFEEDFKKHFSLIDIKLKGEPQKEMIATDVVYRVPIKVVFCENSYPCDWFRIDS